jgi:dihydropyrimidinase
VGRGSEYRGLTREDFVGTTSAPTARVLNMCPRKGTVAVGCDADLVFGDPDATQTISAKHQVNRIDYRVFEGFTCRDLPRTRGKSHGMTATCGPRPVAGKCVARDPFPADPILCAAADRRRRRRPLWIISMTDERTL